MKQDENTSLLLKDLCGRLPFGVIINTPKGDGHLCEINQTIFAIKLGINIDAVKRDRFDLQECKPYLRSFAKISDKVWDDCDKAFNGCETEYRVEVNDWMDKNFIDYRGLIERGLALEAPEDMYD